LLEIVVDQIEALGGFAPTDWSKRSLVRIPGVDPDAPAFFEASTAHEWVVAMRFTVPRNTFQPAALSESLGLVPFAAAAPPVLCDDDRVTTRNVRGGRQEITVTCHIAADVSTVAFSAFVARAVAASHGKRGDSVSFPTAKLGVAEWKAKLGGLPARKKSV
jgi:hypothetical protein